MKYKTEQCLKVANKGKKENGTKTKKTKKKKKTTTTKKPGGSVVIRMMMNFLLYSLGHPSIFLQSRQTLTDSSNAAGAAIIHT